MKKSALRFAAVAALVVGFAVTAAADTVTRGVLQLNATLDKNSRSATAKPITAKNTGYTVALWMKIDDSKCANRTDDIIWSEPSSGGGETAFYYNKTDKKFRMIRYSGYNGASADKVFDADAPTDGGWHFVAGVFDRANARFRIYVDDVCSESTAINVNDVTPQTCFRIGTFDDNSNHKYFGGCMAEMSVWNSALSTEQLQALHWKLPSGDGFTGCIAYWPMDEANHGTNVRDISGGTEYPITLAAIKVGKTDTPAHDLTEVDDFPAEFDAGDTRVFLAVNTQYRSDVSDIVVTDATQDDNGKFLKDAPATFTATSKAPGVTFVRWFGDVPEESVSNATVTIMVDEEKTIVPYFTGIDWLYDPTAKTICDGAWTIGVTVSEDRMTLSSKKNAFSIPYVDLAKRVADAEGNEYVIVSLSTEVFCRNKAIEEVVLPETLETTSAWFDQNDNRNATFLECTSLRSVTPLVPASMTVLGEMAFRGCTSLAGEVTLGGGEAELEVRQSSFTQVGKTQTHGDQFYNTKITGVTVKNTVHSLPLNVFSGCSALSNVVFEAGSITNIASSAFANCKKVTDFAMPERPEGIADNAFSGWTARQCRFVIHASEPRWAAYLADSANFTPWGELDADTKAAYRAKFGRGRRPMGLSLTLPANQWLVSDQAPGLTVLVR